MHARVQTWVVSYYPKRKHSSLFGHATLCFNNFTPMGLQWVCCGEFLIFPLTLRSLMCESQKWSCIISHFFSMVK